MHTRNQKITYPDGEQRNQSDFTASEKNTALPTTIQKKRHTTINESSFYKNKNISYRSTNKLDNSPNGTTVNKPSNPSAPYRTQHNYPHNELRNNNTGIKIKNHNPISTTLRTNKQTKHRFIPESIFIQPLPSKKIKNVTNNIDNHSSNLTTTIKSFTIQYQIQFQHEPKIIPTSN